MVRTLDAGSVSLACHPALPELFLDVLLHIPMIELRIWAITVFDIRVAKQGHILDLVTTIGRLEST